MANQMACQLDVALEALRLAVSSRGIGETADDTVKRAEAFAAYLFSAAPYLMPAATDNKVIIYKR